MTEGGAQTRTGDVLTQLGLVAAALGVDMLVRWSTLDDRVTAVANAKDLYALEQATGLAWEHPVQDATMAWPWLSSFFAGFYVWGYLPVVAASLVWTFVRHRDDAYVELRDSLLVSGAIGMVVYATYPVAPPRLTSASFTDTVTQGSLDAYARPLGVANQLAAVPSFHVAWLLVIAWVLVRATRSRTVLVVSVAYVATMCWAIVASVNHWVHDIPAVAAVSVAGLVGARVVDRVRRRLLDGPAAGS